jgi:hypothetical protein
MKIKCYANNYMNIPEYMEIKLKNNQSVLINISDSETQDEEYFECSEAEILGDAADEYDSDTRFLDEELNIIVNDFDCGLFWEKVIFEDNEGTVIYTINDDEINISSQWNNKIDSEVVNKDDNLNNNKSEIKQNINSNVFDLLKEDEGYIEKGDIMIINGQEYCSFKKLAELSQSLSPDDRIKIIKSIQKTQNKQLNIKNMEEDISR